MSESEVSATYPMLVPAEVLEPPFNDESRYICRRDAGELLDQHLQYLSSHEARCRLTLGRLAQVLLSRRAYRELGFARLGDFARERLGLSSRELNSLAQVTKALEDQPQLARAFEAGEISWTELRQRVTGDGARNDSPASTNKESAGESSGESAEADTIDGEPSVEFRLPCPPSVRFVWRQALELSSRVSGHSLTYWQAAEIIAAEVLAAVSSRGPQADASVAGDAGSDVNRHVDTSVAASWPTGETFEHSYVEPEQVQNEQALDCDGEGECDAECDQGEQSYLYDGLPLPDQPPKLVFPNVRLPEDVSRLTHDAGVISPHELDRRLRRVVCAMQSLDWQTGCMLRTMFSLRLHLELGFPNSSAYIRSRLHIGVRKARGLIAIERATLMRCSELSRAYRSGKISWPRALAILPVLEEDTGHLWVERASRVTLRRLHDEVTWALNRADASNGRSGLAPPPLGAKIDTMGHDLESDPRANGAPGSELHFGAHSSGIGTSFSRVAIRFVGPLSVVAMLHEAMEVVRRPGERRWQTMERMLRMVMHEWNSQPGHRDPVFARDGWRCLVPACSSRCNLQDHHVVFRSRGGDNSLDNRASVCAAHHLHGIHDGWLVASREDEDAGNLRWQLGVRTHGSPLMVLVGDVYVNGAPGDPAVMQAVDRDRLIGISTF